MLNRWLRRRKARAENKRCHDKVARPLAAAGWDPVREPKRAVARVTGVPPVERELLRDYFARACGCSRAEVDRYLALVSEEGLNTEEAEQKVFGGRSRLRPAMEAVGMAMKDFARAVNPH